MGSRSKTKLAYIAGFLDGDGSLMLQIKKRNDGNKAWRFMCTVCFYQDTRHHESLKWIQKIIGIGYISHRKDGMTELRVNGFKQVRDLLRELLPFIKFKKTQADALYKASCLLEKRSKLSRSDLLCIVDCILDIQSSNYATRHKRSRSDILNVLGLTP